MRFQDKIVEYLLEQDQREVAVYFERNMTVEIGKWMFAQGIYRCFQQQYEPEIVLQIYEATGGKMGITLTYFTGAMCWYMKAICDEQVSEVR